MIQPVTRRDSLVHRDDVFNRAAGDVLRLSRHSRARHSILACAMASLPCTAWPLSRAFSLELLFPSALAGHAALLAPSTARAVPLRRLSSLRIFAERKSIASASNARGLAARLDDICQFIFAARRGSCIAAFIPAMFRYPRIRALVTWSNSKSQRRNRLLIFRWGKHLSATRFRNRVKRSHHADVSAGPCEHPVRSAPKTMLRPTIRPRA